MRALLATADRSDRDELERTLRLRGWSVRAVDTGGEAAEALRSQTFALVLLGPVPDARPGDMCRTVRSSEAGRGAQLLVVAGTDDPEAVRELAESGADDYLTAPLCPDHVSGRLALAESRIRAASAGARPERLVELEETLRVERASLEELFRSAPEGIAVVDENDRVVRVNEEFSRMFGYSAEEVLGRAINVLIVPDHLREEGMRLTSGVVRGERIMVETLRRRKDGTLLDVSVLATPIQVADGPIGAYGIYRDITERKTHERALRESESRYRTLFEQSPVGVFICDAARRITHCNDRLPRIMGAPADEIIGTDLRQLQERCILPNLLETEGDATVYRGPYQPLEGGAPIWLSVRYAPLRDVDGTAIGGIGAVEDVTERERAEQRLRAQAAELERVNAALRDRTLEVEEAMQARTRLYSAINHELRTPISAISLYHELLMSGAMGELTPGQSEALEQSHTAALHLLDLVQDVLDLSKLEAGRLRVQPTEVSLPGLLRDLRATALPLVEQYGSELMLEIEGECPPLITDPQRVRQILLNLLSNAAKFGRGNPVRLRCRPGASGVALEVVDGGSGITPEDLPHVFEDFVQVGGAHEGGVGLGLAICTRLAALLHGRLEAESEPEEGSCFRLVLPYSPAIERAEV